MCKKSIVGRSFQLAFLFLLGLVFSDIANAVPIVVAGQGLTVDGTAVLVGGIWQYRYIITETNALAAKPVRFIISEADNHPAGIHHEFDGGNFSYDFAVPPAFLGISAHNYFWNNLAVGAGGAITVGFDDNHGPTMATWGIQRFGAGSIQLVNKLPVPVPEPATILLLLVGGIGVGIVSKFKSIMGS